MRRRLIPIVRGRPLFAYFLCAYVFSWLFAVLAFGLLEVQSEGDLVLSLAVAAFTLIGPTLAAFIVTAATQGRPGVNRLVSRYSIWRVGARWFAFTLLAAPVLLLIGFFAMPGGIAAFQPLPALDAFTTYASVFVVIFFVGGPFGEEPGWRGFALPRLQRGYGPLIGTLALGVLWGIWHLPLFLFIPEYDGAGRDLAGIAGPFLGIVVVSTAISFVFTFVFNNVRGSLLLMMLLHATLNTATSTVPSLFPSLSRDGLAQLMPILVAVGAAVVVVVATRGRLGYEHYRLETEPLDLPAGADPVTRYRRTPLAVAATVLLIGAGGFATQLWDPTAIKGSFDIGGRSLYLECTGQGAPTIVAESGGGGDHNAWRDVVPQVRASNRICTYDRANVGLSDAAPTPRTSADVAADLHRLLAAAHISAPYVLVGHSIGGISMRQFASTYPGEVVGLVLVDPTPITFVEDACGIVDAAACEQFRVAFKPSNDDGIDLDGSAAAIRAASPLPAVPLVVLAANDHGQNGLDPVVRQMFEAMWQRRQQELAATVSTGRIEVVASGHNIQDQDPGAVIAAIRSVLEAQPAQ